MALGTLDTDALAPSPADTAGALGTLSLDSLDIQTLTMLQPMHYQQIYSTADNHSLLP